MNRKLYAIDSITFVFGPALLFAAKGLGNLNAESGYASLKWGFLAVLVLFAVVSNIFYYRNTNEAEIAIGNSALPLVFSLVFVGIFFNLPVIFNLFPSAPMTANMLILSVIFCIFGAHYFYCFGIHFDNVGLLKSNGDPHSNHVFCRIGALLKRVSPLFYVVGGFDITHHCNQHTLKTRLSDDQAALFEGWYILILQCYAVLFMRK